MKQLYCVLIFSIGMFFHCGMRASVDDDRSGGPKPQDVLAQFFNIVAHSLSFAANSGDKDAQLQDLSAMALSVVHIVQLANESSEERERIIEILRSCCGNATTIDSLERCCEKVLTDLDR